MEGRLISVVAYAASKHTTQRRKNVAKTPFIEHPIRVAEQLVTIGNVQDYEILAAALLHDTVEDTDATLEEIEQMFGVSIARYVQEVTDDKSLPCAERKRLQIAHASLLTPGAKLIKLSDKLHNMGSLLDEIPVGWTVLRVQGYMVWGRAVVNAMRGTNAALESAIDRVLSGSFVLNGITYPCVPVDVDLDAFLEQYYASV